MNFFQYLSCEKCPYCFRPIPDMAGGIKFCPSCHREIYYIFERQKFVTRFWYFHFYNKRIREEWKQLNACYNFSSQRKQSLGKKLTVLQLVLLVKTGAVSKRVKVYDVQTGPGPGVSLEIYDIIDVFYYYNAASDRQLALLKALGYNLNYFVTKTEAHLLIDGIRAGHIPAGEECEYNPKLFSRELFTVEQIQNRLYKKVPFIGLHQPLFCNWF